MRASYWFGRSNFVLKTLDGFNALKSLRTKPETVVECVKMKGLKPSYEDKSTLVNFVSHLYKCEIINITFMYLNLYIELR